jgi:hypothetical protein
MIGERTLFHVSHFDELTANLWRTGWASQFPAALHQSFSPQKNMLTLEK